MLVWVQKASKLRDPRGVKRREALGERRTLNADMDVRLLRLGGLACVLVGFGEGVYEEVEVSNVSRDWVEETPRCWSRI